MTYTDIVNILENQNTDQILDLLTLTDPADLVMALSDYIESHQEEIITEITENGLI